MHDLDNTKLELETDGEQYYELQDPSVAGEFDEQSELSPVEELELASELLGVGSEQELDLFLGGLFKKAKKFLRGPAGSALGGLLKNVAQKALPIAGGALGGFVGGPLGASLGSQLASQAGSMFGLELEGLSPQDQEFEVAKSFVRLANTAANNLGTMASKAVSNPAGAAKDALIAAAQQHAPGLLKPVGGAVQGALQQAAAASGLTGSHRSGRWVRQGSRIVLFGL